MNAEATTTRDNFRVQWTRHMGALAPATALGSSFDACVAVGVVRAAIQRCDGGPLVLPWLDTDAIADFAIGATVLIAGGVPIGEVLGPWTRWR